MYGTPPLGGQDVWRDFVAYEQHRTEHGVGRRTRTRWVVLAAALVALALVVILLIAYSGGSGGGSY
jgi:hypothetical protein